MPILSDAVLLGCHNFLWAIPILSQSDLIRNCWAIRILRQLDHTVSNIQSLTRHQAPSSTYQISPPSSSKNSTMSSPFISVPNFTLNVSSLAVDRLSCNEPLPSTSATSFSAQSNSPSTSDNLIHEAHLTLPISKLPDPSTPTSPTPRILPEPDPTFSPLPPPSPSPNQVPHSNEMACQDHCSFASSFSFPLCVALPQTS